MRPLPTRSLAAVILALSGEALSAGSNTFGVPSYLDQATYTINDYQQPHLTDLSRSHGDGDRFSGQLMYRLNGKYPSIRTLRTVNLRDADVTRANYIGGTQSANEMVHFCGHGTWQGIQTHETYHVFTTDKAYGGWTRWLFSSACQVLNRKDPAHYAGMFGGLHAVFGYESDSFEYIKKYNCNIFGANCSYRRSEDVWNHFAEKWVTQELFMYDAWVEAVRATIYNQGGYGVAPAAVYLYGTVDGRGFIGGCEKVYNMYNGDVSWASLSKVHRYETYGTPEY